MTLPALAGFPNLREIHCAELEPAVVENQRFWHFVNGHVLEEHRVRPPKSPTA